MFGIIAHQGPEEHLFLRACEIAKSLGSVVSVVFSTPHHRMAIMGESAAVAVQSRSVFYGSAAIKSAEFENDADTFLDGAPDDVVGAAVFSGELVLGAGRGNHRLFVHELGENILASSSLSVLARTVNSRIDRSYEDFLLGFSFLPIPQTPYEGIRALVPGTRWAHGKSNSIKASSITSAAPVDSFSDAIPELRKRFFESLEDIAAGQKSHAVLLGGFDSMLVAASLKNMGHDVHTYTFSFGDPRFEQKNVAEFVERHKVTHHPVHITPELIAENLKQFGTWFFQPGALAHYQIHTLVASQQIARDGFTRIFNGDGCDALFLSYPTVNRRAAVTSRLGHLPGWSVAALQKILQTRIAERRLGHVARTGRSVLGNFALQEPARGHLPNRYLDDYALSLLRRGETPVQTERLSDIRYRLASDVAGQISTRRAFHGNGLTAQSKVKVDGAVALGGLPHFTPYTHPHFRSFVSSLPIDFLKKQDSSPGDNGKEVLVAMVREYELLSHDVINQPKQSPSDSPVDGWYRNELRKDVYSQLEDLPFEWNRKYIDDVLSHKIAENWFKNKVAIDHHALQAIGLLLTYASFNRAINS